MRPSRPKSRVKSVDRTDWTRVESLSDKQIDEAVANDPDTFIPDKDWWKGARLVFPGTKRLISLRLDEDVLEWFRARGPGYQTRINAVLRSYVEAAKG
jgi:uncharacterized protein (DUF4415 family)